MSEEVSSNETCKIVLKLKLSTLKPQVVGRTDSHSGMMWDTKHVWRKWLSQKKVCQSLDWKSGACFYAWI